MHGHTRHQLRVYQVHADIWTVCEIHSKPMREIRNAIQAALDHRRAADIWDLFELKCLLLEGSRNLLARGIRLAPRSSPDDSRIVILLEELGLQREHSEP